MTTMTVMVCLSILYRVIFPSRISRVYICEPPGHTLIPFMMSTLYYNFLSIFSSLDGSTTALYINDMVIFLRRHARTVVLNTILITDIAAGMHKRCACNYVYNNIIMLVLFEV